jgi:hypothetical protein
MKKRSGTHNGVAVENFKYQEVIKTTKNKKESTLIFD